MSNLDRAELYHDLQESTREIMEILRIKLKEELQGQGHINTSALANSLTPQIKAVTDIIVGEMWANDYWIFVDQGVSSGRIPYTPGTGSGGTSKYIQGLINYFLTKGLPQTEAKRAAFATARSHKREGMPTSRSFRFSSNGRRRLFVDQVLNDNARAIDEMIETKYGNQVEAAFFDMLGRLAKSNDAISIKG